MSSSNASKVEKTTLNLKDLKTIEGTILDLVKEYQNVSEKLPTRRDIAKALINAKSVTVKEVAITTRYIPKACFTLCQLAEFRKMLQYKNIKIEKIPESVEEATELVGRFFQWPDKKQEANDHKIALNIMKEKIKRIFENPEKFNHITGKIEIAREVKKESGVNLEEITLAVNIFDEACFQLIQQEEDWFKQYKIPIPEDLKNQLKMGQSKKLKKKISKNVATVAGWFDSQNGKKIWRKPLNEQILTAVIEEIIEEIKQVRTYGGKGRTKGQIAQTIANEAKIKFSFERIRARYIPEACWRLYKEKRLEELNLNLDNNTSKENAMELIGNYLCWVNREIEIQEQNYASEVMASKLKKILENPDLMSIFTRHDLAQDVKKETKVKIALNTLEINTFENACLRLFYEQRAFLEALGISISYEDESNLTQTALKKEIRRQIRAIWKNNTNPIDPAILNRMHDRILHIVDQRYSFDKIPTLTELGYEFNLHPLTIRKYIRRCLEEEYGDLKLAKQLYAEVWKSGISPKLQKSLKNIAVKLSYLRKLGRIPTLKTITQWYRKKGYHISRTVVSKYFLFGLECEFGNKLIAKQIYGEMWPKDYSLELINLICNRAKQIYRQFQDTQIADIPYDIPSIIDITTEFRQQGYKVSVDRIRFYLKKSLEEDLKETHLAKKIFAKLWLHAIEEEIRENLSLLVIAYAQHRKQQRENGIDEKDLDEPSSIVEIQEELRSLGHNLSRESISSSLYEGLKQTIRNQIDIKNTYIDLWGAEISPFMQSKISQIFIEDQQNLKQNKGYLIQSLRFLEQQHHLTRATIRKYGIIALQNTYGLREGLIEFQKRCAYIQNERFLGDQNHKILERIAKEAQEINIKNNPEWPDVFFETKVNGKIPDLFWADVFRGKYRDLCFKQLVDPSLPIDFGNIPQTFGELFNISPNTAKKYKNFAGDFGTYCNIESLIEKWSKYCRTGDTFLVIMNTGYWPYGNKLVFYDSTYPDVVIVRAELGAKFFQFPAEQQKKIALICNLTRNRDIEEISRLASIALSIRPQQGSQAYNDYIKNNKPNPNQSLDNYPGAKDAESPNKSNINNSPQDNEKEEFKASISPPIIPKAKQFDSRAICAALFPNRRHQLLMRCVEEELAWEEYQRQVATNPDGKTSLSWSAIPNKGAIPAEIPTSTASRNEAFNQRKNIDSRSSERFGHKLEPPKRDIHAETVGGEISKHPDHSIDDQRDINPVPVPVPEDASIEYSRQVEDATHDPETDPSDDGENASTDPDDAGPEEENPTEPGCSGEDGEDKTTPDACEDPSPEAESTPVENTQDAAEGEEETDGDDQTGKAPPPTPKETPAQTTQEPSQEAPQPTVEVSSDGRSLLLESGNPGNPVPSDDKGNKRCGDRKDGETGNGGIPLDNSKLSGEGNPNPLPQRGNDTAMPITDGKPIEVRGQDLQSIRNSAAYGDGALVIDKGGKGVLLSPTDAKNIQDALDHVQKSLNNAREGVCGPDPDTRIRPDGSDATGDGKRGIPVSGLDLHDIKNAGKHGDGMFITGEHGGIHLSEKDTRDIRDALDHVQKSLDNARTDMFGPDPATKTQPDGRDITADCKHGIPITGQDLNAIKHAGERREGVLITGERGSLHLTGKDTRDIHGALDHVQKSLVNARTDMFRPDPTTKAQPDGRDITGEGKHAIPISGQDLNAIKHAGERGEGVLIHGDRGSLHLDGKDTKHIGDALDHVRHQIAAARPEGARQSVDRPVVDGSDIKNANPKEDPYAIHAPLEAREKVDVAPTDLRDIRAAGRGEVGGPVVIETNAGRKVFPRETAERINNALDRVGLKLSNIEWKLVTREKSDHSPTRNQVDQPTREKGQDPARENHHEDSRPPARADTPQQSAAPVPDKPAEPTAPTDRDHPQVPSEPLHAENHPNAPDTSAAPLPDSPREAEGLATREHGKVPVGTAEGDLCGVVTRRDGRLGVEGKKIDLEPFEWRTDPREQNDKGTDPPASKEPPDKPAPGGDDPHPEEPNGESGDPSSPDSGSKDTPTGDQPPENQRNEDPADYFLEDREDEWEGWNPDSGYDTGGEDSKEDDPDQDNSEENDDDEWAGWNPESGTDTGEEGTDPGEDPAGDGEVDHDQGDDPPNECPDRGERGSFL